VNGLRNVGLVGLAGLVGLVGSLLASVGCGDAEPGRLSTTLGRVEDVVRAGVDVDAGEDMGVDAGEDVGEDVGADVDEDVGVDVGADVDVGVGADVGVDVGVGADVSDDTSATTDTHEADTGPETIDLQHPDPALARLSEATLTSIAAQMDAALDVAALSGRTFGGLVVDIDTDQVIWDKDADRLLIPASNTKVFTTAAAFDRLGPDHRMLTRVYAAGAIGVGGVLAGDLDLHSEHDFTWSHWFYDNPRHPADRIADALWNLGLRRVNGGVGVWGAYLYEGHHFGSYDPATQRTRAGNAFIAALAARGITVVGGQVDHATMALPPGQELTRWESIPLHVGAWAILRKSHNEMSDILARHLGYLEMGSSDYVAGGAVIAQWLADIGVDATGFRVSDGSGLATDNRVSARQIVGVYRYMAHSPLWDAWRAALSLAGAGGAASTDANDVAVVTRNTAPYNGTLAGRMTGADTAGRVFGKSGTNAGITTSGVLYNRWDGHRYAFAFEMNTLPAGTADIARVTQDALVAVVAGDLGKRGTRPAAPTLGCARGRADGTIEIAVDDAIVASDDARAGIALETSPDGVTWRRDDALLVRAAPFVFRAPANAATLYVRARVESSVGISDPSDVYAVRVQPGPRVLLVDADDRWQRQPTNENPMGAAHAFMVAYAAAVPAGMAFDTCPNEVVAFSGIGLAAYDAVVWTTGEEATTDESISAMEQQVLADYLAVGGALFVSGAEVAWDLDPAGNSLATAADADFARDTLRATYVGDDAGTFVVEGTPGGIFADRHHNTRIGFWTPGQIFVAYPDELAPVAGASASLSYLGPGTIAAVQSASDPAVVVLGFPFESIDAARERALVMERVLTFLGL